MQIHEQLLQDLKLLWDGKPDLVSPAWKEARSPNHNYARIGASGSRNIAWMANAIGCHFRDTDSIIWVRDSAARELQHVTTDTHKYRAWCYEFLSLVYDAWNWVAEVSAMTFIRRIPVGSGKTSYEMLDDADAWVTRLLAHHAALWAVHSIPEIRARRENGRIYWQGPGGYPAGLRSHPMAFWQSNLCGVSALGIEPDVDNLNPEGEVPFICNACTDWGLSQAIQQACLEVIQGDYSHWDVLSPYLTGPTGIRTAVPWALRRFPDGTVTSTISERIEGGNTGAVWGTQISGPDNRVIAYPYTSDRVRSGSPELGMGDASTYCSIYRAWNLSEGEAESPSKGPRVTDSFLLPEGAVSLVLTWATDRDGWSGGYHGDEQSSEITT